MQIKNSEFETRKENIQNKNLRKVLKFDKDSRRNNIILELFLKYLRRSTGNRVTGTGI